MQVKTLVKTFLIICLITGNIIALNIWREPFTNLDQAFVGAVLVVELMIFGVISIGNLSIFLKKYWNKKLW